MLTTVRCLEHTIHLAAGDFIKALSPKMRTWTKNQTVDGDEEAADEDIDWVAEWNQLDALLDDEVVDDEVEFEAGDTLGKALALVNQVSLLSTTHSVTYLCPQIRASPQAKVFFAKCCFEEDIPVLELIKWIRTRWGSMHDFIERLTSCKAVKTSHLHF
jgi:hypothetical protein